VKIGDLRNKGELAPQKQPPKKVHIVDDGQRPTTSRRNLAYNVDLDESDNDIIEMRHSPAPIIQKKGGRRNIRKIKEDDGEVSVKSKRKTVWDAGDSDYVPTPELEQRPLRDPVKKISKSAYQNAMWRLLREVGIAEGRDDTAVIISRTTAEKRPVDQKKLTSRLLSTSHTLRDNEPAGLGSVISHIRQGQTDITAYMGDYIRSYVRKHYKEIKLPRKRNIFERTNEL
jgi:hypothetical protein